MEAQLPLVDTGTLGTKGHVQTIVPFASESYAQQHDPDDARAAIPYCTLKSFPATITHCIEWARDKARVHVATHRRVHYYHLTPHASSSPDHPLRYFTCTRTRIYFSLFLVSLRPSFPSGLLCTTSSGTSTLLTHS